MVVYMYFLIDVKWTHYNCIGRAVPAILLPIRRTTLHPANGRIFSRSLAYAGFEPTPSGLGGILPYKQSHQSPVHIIKYFLLEPTCVFKTENMNYVSLPGKTLKSDTTLFAIKKKKKNEKSKRIITLTKRWRDGIGKQIKKHSNIK